MTDKVQQGIERYAETCSYWFTCFGCHASSCSIKLTVVSKEHHVCHTWLFWNTVLSVHVRLEQWGGNKSEFFQPHGERYGRVTPSVRSKPTLKKRKIDSWQHSWDQILKGVYKVGLVILLTTNNMGNTDCSKFNDIWPDALFVNQNSCVPHYNFFLSSSTCVVWMKSHHYTFHIL